MEYPNLNPIYVGSKKTICQWDVKNKPPTINIMVSKGVVSRGMGLDGFLKCAKKFMVKIMGNISD